MSSDLLDGWQISSLGGVSLGKGEYGANVSKADFDPALPRYVRITDISDQGTLIPTSLASISHEAAKGYFLKEGDLLFARSGATVGKSLLYQSHYGPCAFAGYLIRFRLDPAKIDPYFARNIVQSAEYWDWIATVQRAQAQPNINAQEYATLPLMLPPLDEQQRIAEVLRSVDEAIAAADAVARQWETAFAALLEAAFTEGEPSSLDDVCSLIYRYPGFYGFDQLEEGVPVIRGEHLRAGRISTDWTDFYFVDPEFSARFPKTILQLNDVVMSVRGTVGTTAVVGGSHVGSQISPNLIRLVANSARIIPPLLYYAVQSAVAHMRRTIVNAQALPAINAGDIKRVEIALPPLREQTGLLAQLNGAAEATAQAIAAGRQARETKGMLMSDLLSGRVRVPA